MLKAAVVAGLIAGGAVAVYHVTVTEPVIDRAIQQEDDARRAHGAPSAPSVVGRATQKAGLAVGFLAYGLVWGLLFGVANWSAGRQLPLSTTAKRGWVLAAVGGWAVTVFPFLKYPANPPGVGDAQTIGARQAVYFTFVALSVVGLGLAVSLARLVARAVPERPLRAWPVAVVTYLLYAVVLYLAMPANPDPIRVSAALVWRFRTLSLIGLLLFWVVLGGAFGWIAGGRSRG